jgi:serine/threonine-protein kinase
MATVYLARTSDANGSDRQVALKLVHAHLRADKESKLHLLEEAKLAALIQHRNVVRVLEIDEDPFGVFLVMDYVAGESLSGLARLAREAGQKLPWRLIARVLNDALLGLHAAHELVDADGKALGLVHRDFSPQNILVSMQGETQLGDFGVAKAADRAVRTKTGLTKGKIAYMSPEQARGHAVDRRCDVWAAGVIVWELLAGQRLYRSDDDVATLLSIVTEQPPRLRQVLPDAPQALDDAIASALQPMLEQRCPTAEEFRCRLERAWQEADGMADAREVADFMQRVVGPELESRGDRITQLKSSRVQPRVRLESASAVANGAPASAALQLVNTVHDLPSAPRHRGIAEHGGLEHTEDSVTTLAVHAADLHIDNPEPPAPTARRGDEFTETSAVVPTFKSAPRSGWKWVALGAGLVGALSVALAIGGARSDHERGSATDRDNPEAKPGDERLQDRATPATQDSSTNHTSSPTLEGPAAVRGADAKGAEVSGAATPTPKSAHRRPGYRRRGTAHEGSGETSTGVGAASPAKPGAREKPTLATSPYAGSKSSE